MAKRKGKYKRNKREIEKWDGDLSMTKAERRRRLLGFGHGEPVDIYNYDKRSAQGKKQSHLKAGFDHSWQSREFRADRAYREWGV